MTKKKLDMSDFVRRMYKKETKEPNWGVPQGTKNMKDMFNLPKAKLKKMSKDELLAYMRKRNKKTT